MEVKLHNLYSDIRFYDGSDSCRRLCSVNIKGLENRKKMVKNNTKYNYKSLDKTFKYR